MSLVMNLKLPAKLDSEEVKILEAVGFKFDKRGYLDLRGSLSSLKATRDWLINRWGFIHDEHNFVVGRILFKRTKVLGRAEIKDLGEQIRIQFVPRYELFTYHKDGKYVSIMVDLREGMIIDVRNYTKCDRKNIRRWFKQNYPQLTTNNIVIATSDTEYTNHLDPCMWDFEEDTILTAHEGFRLVGIRVGDWCDGVRLRRIGQVGCDVNVSTSRQRLIKKLRKKGTECFLSY